MRSNGAGDGIRRLLVAVVIQAAEDVCVLRRRGLVVTPEGLAGEWPERRGVRVCGLASDGRGLGRADAEALCRWINDGSPERWLALAGVDVGDGVDVAGCLMAAGIDDGGWERWMREERR